jgi:hypothetical protein
MVLSGKRGIRMPEIDRIAAFFHVLPSALFDDPDLTAPRRDATGKDARHAQTRSTSYAARRIKEQQELIRQQQQIIQNQQRGYDEALSYLEPLTDALVRIASVESAHPQDRRDLERPGKDRARRDRPVRTGSR